MKNVITFPKLRETKTDDKHKHWFGAANGISGFRSYFGQIYDSSDHAHIYVIKGGPGTGKSRLMHDFADAFYSWGADEIEYIHCSSEPDSLDGVTVSHKGSRVAVMDGTAPHTRCAVVPGIIDEIVNVGENWDPSYLLENKSRILRMCERKSQSFSRAYSFLGAMEKPLDLQIKAIHSVMDYDKMKAAIARLCKNFASGNEFRSSIRLISCISTKGYVCLDTLRHAKKVFYVTDVSGSASFYLHELYYRLASIGKNIISVCSPLSEQQFEGIFIPEDDVSFIATKEVPESDNSKTINTLRFIKKSELSGISHDIKLMRSICSSLFECALSSLKSAGEYHSELEKIYTASMDFSKNEKISEKLISNAAKILKI